MMIVGVKGVKGMEFPSPEGVASQGCGWLSWVEGGVGEKGERLMVSIAFLCCSPW
jgi:hypothetical protein